MPPTTRQYKSGGQADAGGRCEVDMAPPAGYVWQVTNISVTSNSIGAPTCSVFLNTTFVCGTNIGTQDSADGSPVPVRQGDTLRLVWSGAQVGSSCSVLIIVQEDITGSGLV